MSSVDELVAFLRRCVDEDELWAKAASADRDGKTTVPGGVHWTWAVGEQWEPVEADPLQPYMGGYDGQWSNPVVLRTVEEWQLDWGGPNNKLPLKIAESEELRTADGAHIALHDPARVLREVEATRRHIDQYEAAVDIHGRAVSEYKQTGSQVKLLQVVKYDGKVQALRFVLLDDAAVFVDRPGFQETWKP